MLLYMEKGTSLLDCLNRPHVITMFLWGLESEKGIDYLRQHVYERLRLKDATLLVLMVGKGTRNKDADGSRS